MSRLSRFGRRGALGAILIALALVVSACGGATPSPSPSPTPTASPSPSPTPTASPSPSPTLTPSPTPGAAVDPIDNLTIDSPYELTELPSALADTLESSIAPALEGYGGLFSVGARQVSQSGQAEGFLIVMGLPPVISDNPTTMDGLMSAMLGSVGGNLKPTVQKIAGHDVTLIEKEGQPVALFVVGPNVYMVFGATTASNVAVATALISANG